MSFRSEIRAILGEAFTDEISDKLTALHRGIVDPLKDERDDLKKQAEKFKADAEKLPAVQQELDDLKSGDYKAKWEKTHGEYEAYKKQVAHDAETAKIERAFRGVLKAEHISEKYHDDIVRVTDFSGKKLDKDGNLENADKIGEEVRSKWSNFKETHGTTGAQVATPPATSPAKPTKEQIMAIKDDGARQKAIAENHELFGF